MMEKRVIILSSQEDYWEACYVDGTCVEQAHHLGEGYGKLHFIKEICKKYAVSLDDVVELGADPEDDENAMNTGAFPEFFSELKGDYSLEDV